MTRPFRVPDAAITSVPTPSPGEVPAIPGEGSWGDVPPRKPRPSSHDDDIASVPSRSPGEPVPVLPPDPPAQQNR